MALNSRLVFNETYYLAQNPDVKNAIGKVLDAAGTIFTSGLDHFTRAGAAEGRVATPLFNVDAYKANNPDLAEAGITTDAALRAHFYAYGAAEGRVALSSNVFNLDFYKANNSDLVNAGLTDAQIVRHFYEYGAAEGRQATANFSVAAYKAANADLAGLSDSVARAHWYTYGAGEGRAFPQASQAFNITAASNTVTEGSALTFTVTSVLPVAADTTFTYNITGDTSGGSLTAAGPADFGALTGTVTILAGSSTATFTVTPTNDVTVEGLEGFRVSLFDANLTVVRQSAVVAIRDGVSSQTFKLTSGIDLPTGTSAGDTFDGSVNAEGTATLTSVDVLDGAGGNDLLIAELNGQTVAPTLTSIESIELVTRTTAATFDLINATGVTSVLVRNSSVGTTIDNVNSTELGLTVRDQAGDVTINFTNAALASSANAATITLSNAQRGAGNGPTLTLAQKSGADSSGLETLTLNSAGSNQNFLSAVTGASIKTLNVTGSNSVSINTGLDTSVVTVNAGTLTGGLSASLANVVNNLVVTGGTGNDAFTFSANTANVSVSGGTGNDSFTFSGSSTFNTNDTVAGGDGSTDTLSIKAAEAEAFTATAANVTGIERLTLNTAATASASTNATLFGDIARVSLTGTNGAYGVTLGAGTREVRTSAALGGTLTLTDTGTLNTDAVSLVNTRTADADNFADQAVTSNGFETITINTGSDANGARVATVQNIATLTVTGDSTTGINTVKFAGANRLDVDGLVSNSTGVFVIDGSALTGHVDGTTTLDIVAPTFSGGIAGTVSIIGSGGQDVLIGHTSAANTIDGGAGVDTVTGGSAADSLLGGDGADSITGGGGNDTIGGGAGNDTINVTAGGAVSIDGGVGDDVVLVGDTLTSADTIVGGDGIDRITITAAATASSATGVSGFEILGIDVSAGSVSQDLIQFTNNTGFTGLAITNGANTATASNLGASVATVSFSDAALTGFVASRLIDTTSNALALSAATYTNARIFSTVTVNDEETLSFATGTVASGGSAAGGVTITTLNASDVRSLTVTGAGNFTVTNAITGAADLATVNAAALTGTFSVNASTSVANMTVSGSLTAANTVTGGTGDDTITGGDVGDSLTGGNGRDSLIGGGGSDTLDGGLGADVINGGIGADTITGGGGNDTLTGGDGADTFVFQAAGGVDRILDFVSGSDKLDVTTGYLSAVAGSNAITAAGTANSVTIADNNVYFVSTNGAAANLTTSATNTLNVADLTADTLTNFATYLDERFAGTGSNGDDAIIVINWTAGGNTVSYMYEYVEANADTVITAAELTLLGVIDRGTTVLTTGDVI